SLTSNQAAAALNEAVSAGLLGAGGAIYATASLTLSKCTISSNTATGSNTFASSVGTTGGAGEGGGVYAGGSLSVTGCTFSANFADGGTSGEGGNGGSGFGGAIF